MTHSATVMANGLMHFGTTSDVFLRENLDWLKRASNWAKFSATASLGLIHYVSCVCVCVWLGERELGSSSCAISGLYFLFVAHLPIRTCTVC